MVRWTDPQLDKITLLELTLILDAWQVTQCEGRLKDGTRVWVSVPFKRLPRYGLRRMIITYAKEDGVYAKRLGIFDAIK
jgi:IS4 transposase